MRLIKSEEEVKRIKKSTEISEKAIMEMINAVREGITDIDFYFKFIFKKEKTNFFNYKCNLLS
ncbi:hypothetical protein ES703_54299 [subsurface metagenome]